MGVQEPVEEAFVEVPATPPGVRDLDSDDDLYAKTNEEEKRPLSSYKNDLFKGDLPVIPYKGMFDFLGVQDEKVIWHLKSPNKKKKEPCPSCVEEVKRDLQKFEEFVEDYRNERDSLKSENESLKKEVEELKKLLKQRDNDNVGVKVSISNKEEDPVDVLVRKRSLENNSFKYNNKYDLSNPSVLEQSNNYGVRSFSITLPRENVHQSSINKGTTVERDTKARKSVAQLRKGFFEKAFQSEQKTFTSRNYLEINPGENKNTFRSRINVRVTPKTRISEVISKLTSNSGSKIIPEAPPVTLFQRFEKTKVVWENDLKKRFVIQRSY